MRIPYFGRLSLRWCMGCNVPVLGERCGVCGGTTAEVQITPPGDARPAFQGDVELINKTLERQFGCRLLPEEKVVVLNKASGLERFDEVVMDGHVLGALRYDPGRGAFEFLPRLEGARRIWALSRRKYVEVDTGAREHIVKGASVLMPGVTDFDRGIERDEEVIVVSGGEVIGVGRSRLSGEEALAATRGAFAKTRRGAPPEGPKVLEGGQDWSLAVRANGHVLERHEQEARDFISRVAEGPLPKAVAFSGGKDSLATLLLVRKVLQDFSVIFVDTDVEFPETLAYVERIAARLSLRLLRGSSGGNFWRGLEYFGPPGRDYRWCCKVSKMGPTARVIKEHFPGGCVNFVGQRRYESEVRAKSGRVWRNPWLPNQLAASPIQDWTALHIWLYLMREGVEVNSLYARGMERIGCWACPASDLTELEILKGTHPDLWASWEARLREAGIPEEEVAGGGWRWKEPPEQRSGGGRRLGELRYRLDGGAYRGTFGALDMGAVANLARALGPVVLEKDAIRIGDSRLYRDGSFQVPEVEGEDGMRDLLGVVERSRHCLGCGVCLAQCPADAIELANGRARIEGSCRSCGKCHCRCPIVRYGANNMPLVRA